MDAKTLARIHRVRALQVTLAQGEEARARDKAGTEHALSGRIATLAAAVAPVAEASSGFSMGASAHFRERLHASAEAAIRRVDAAERHAAHAADATRAARQDRTAVEKLIERARRDATAREMRALEDTPGTPRANNGRKRHDPC